MSWSGFKKNVGRATTQVMMKTGHVEKTSDREYEVEERRYRTLESASLRLQKEAKGYLDSLRAMTASQMRIAETIDAFYGDSGATDGVSRSYKQAVEDLDAETVKALDGPYRTTVLEPINRFCAYFPDINECIKKRNHKMLDYDAMRSKVKKLVEKPDKDPSKLPRTEKETEMVMDASTFLRTCDHLFDELPTSPNKEDLMFPSPPKALDGLKQTKKTAKINDDEDAALRSVGLRRKSSVLRRVSRLGSVVRKSWIGMSPTETPSEDSEERHLLKPPSPAVRSSWASSRSGFNMPLVREASTESLGSPASPPSSGNIRNTFHGKSPTPRHASVPLPTVRLRDFASTPTRSQKEKDKRDSASLKRNSIISDKTVTPTTHKKSTDTDHSRTRLTPTPFFNPSELEDIMRPFKEQFIQERADELAQAKAAYEQLNQQLTDELPQLIDLRVPYLDPSFEALVKIQLRFCAEAYSRMAQVQQYLDASTRDQYASGDLDARVEDVLGQIRELSIAGTV